LFAVLLLLRREESSLQFFAKKKKTGFNSSPPALALKLFSIETSVKRNISNELKREGEEIQTA
jgi:hypothetical protein